MASPTTASQVIKKVNQPGLTLVKNGYWQFTYDRIINGHRVHHHYGVNATRLSDLSMGQWEREAKAFMDSLQSRIAHAEAMLPPGTYTGRILAVTEGKDGRIDAQFQVDMPKDTQRPVTLLAINIKAGDYNRERRDRLVRLDANARGRAYRDTLKKELSQLMKKHGYKKVGSEDGYQMFSEVKVRDVVVKRIAKLQRMLKVTQGKHVDHKSYYEFDAGCHVRRHRYSCRALDRFYGCTTWKFGGVNAPESY